MKNHSLKTSAASYEVKSSLDSNRKNISINSRLLHRALFPAFAQN
jgi:hypothetical protein